MYNVWSQYKVPWRHDYYKNWHKLNNFWVNFNFEVTVDRGNTKPVYEVIRKAVGPTRIL